MLLTRVKVTTILDTIVYGRIYSFCPITNTITLAEDPEPASGKQNPNQNKIDKHGPEDYRIIKAAFIKDVAVLGAGGDQDGSGSKKEHGVGAFQKAIPTIGPVKIEYLPVDEKEGIRQFLHNRAISGVGVSAEAQALFNALHKLVPCHWSDKSIIALDEVRIEPPYSPESCSSLHVPADTKSLNYVKQVVKGLQDNLKGG